MWESIRDSTCCLRMIILLLDASSIAEGGVHRDNNPDQLFGVGALAHRGLHTVRGFVREVLLAFTALLLSAREGCPGHCDTLFTGHISSRLVGPSSYPTAPRSLQSGWKDFQSVPRRLLWLPVQGAHPSEAVHMFKWFSSCVTLTYHTLGENMCTVF